MEVRDKFQIKNRFEKQLKTATAFIDLTAAYDIVWQFVIWQNYEIFMDYTMPNSR